MQSTNFVINIKYKTVIFTTIKAARGRLSPLVLPSVNLHRPLASVNLHRPPVHAHVRPPAHAPTPRELRIEEEEAVEARSQLNLPSMDGSVAELEAAERVVMPWDSSLACGGADEPMLFDGGGNRAEADRFLRAVDDLRRLAPPSPAAVGSPRRLSSSSAARKGVVLVAMTRLEAEFRHVLSSRALDHEIEALAYLSSLSINGDRSNSASSADLPAADEDDSVSSSIGRRSTAYRSLRSIREIDLLPDDAVADLRECAQAYASVRKTAVDASLCRLGVEHLSIGDVQRLEWDALEAKIRRWIRAARAAVRGVFASERRLCFHIFHDLPISAASAPATHDTPFAEAIKGAALQLFGFAEAISIGRRSPREALQDHRPPRCALGPPTRRLRYLRRLQGRGVHIRAGR
jgi:exocyst complex component 7